MNELILGLALIFGLYMAWNIGANDVANAMGTSVGSGALTLRQAVLVAAVLEFAGAFLVGGHVTETLRSDILFSEHLGDSVPVLSLGMLSSLLAAGAWLQLATYFGWPVSTTHSIVGAIVGFAMAAGGLQSVQWESVGTIVGSWILSPLMGGTAAFVIFSLIRSWIINSDHPRQTVVRSSPLLIFLVVYVLTLMTVWKGLANLNLDLPIERAVLAATGVAAVAAVVGYLLISRLSAHDIERRNRPIIEGKEVQEGSHLDPQFAFVERIFGYLQILSACSVAFAHGSNDVANAIGPIASIYTMVETNSVEVVAPVPAWILALGGAGIVVGLATWGYKVIATIGGKITELTPSRGFSAEFAGSCTIIVASRMGLPISTTHTLVGAVLGVGLARGLASVNLRVFRDIVASWISTVPAVAVLSAVIYLVLRTLLLP